MDKSAQTDSRLNQILKNRWSPRAFASRVPAHKDLYSILEAARWAPSCSNEQPWRFLIGIKGTNAFHDYILETLDKGNQIWAKSAPVLMLIYYKETFARNSEANPWAEYDAGQAAAHMSIQAMHLNLYVHQMAGFDADAAAKLITSDEDIRVISALALGYLGNPEQLPEKLAQRERAERTRKTLNDIILVKSFVK
jgi:nitroreductase